jgi:hypothetical protein
LLSLHGRAFQKAFLKFERIILSNYYHFQLDWKSSSWNRHRFIPGSKEEHILYLFADIFLLKSYWLPFRLILSIYNLFSAEIAMKVEVIWHFWANHIIQLLPHNVFGTQNILSIRLRILNLELSPFHTREQRAYFPQRLLWRLTFFIGFMSCHNLKAHTLTTNFIVPNPYETWQKG